MDEVGGAGAGRAHGSFPALGDRARARGLAVRPIAEGDTEFLAELYASTRREEMAPVPWSEAEKEAFLRQQFEAQHRHYQQHYADAQFLVLERFGTGIGRLYLHLREDEVRLVDIALLPQQRGNGVGTAVLEDLLESASARGLAVRIHVEANNPAKTLYERLGFCERDHNGVYRLMEWRSPGEPA